MDTPESTFYDVTLKRKTVDEPWGFMWRGDALADESSAKVRIVGAVLNNSPCGRWNAMNSFTAPELCVTAGDILCVMNGHATREWEEKCWAVVGVMEATFTFERPAHPWHQKAVVPYAHLNYSQTALEQLVPERHTKQLKTRKYRDLVMEKL